MLNYNKLQMALQHTKQTIALSDILCADTAPASELLRAQVLEHGQTALLTAISNGDGKYHLLSGDAIYQAMSEAHHANQEKFKTVDCLVVESAALSKTQRELLVAYHEAELEPQSTACKLRIADLLLALAGEGVLSRRNLTAVMAEMLEIEPRYAGMFLAIAENATPELREAVITPSSGKHKSKSAHIPVHVAARYAQQLPEVQRRLIRERTEAHSQTPEQRKQKAIGAWLEEMEKKLNGREPLTKEEQALLKKAQRLMRKQNQLAKQRQSQAESNQN